RALPDLLALVRGLLRERIPLPPLDAVLGAIAGDRRFAEESERGRWGELLREHTAGYWLHERIAAQEQLGAIVWVRPTADAEEELAERLIEGLGGRVLSLSADERAAWQSAVCDAGGRAVVVLTTAAGRASFATLLRGVVPFVPVISVAEMRAADHPEPAADAVRWLDAP
ncbi:MAG: hypothetical protein R3A79_28430, partial [Nannocystaceae bacterium]